MGTTDRGERGFTLIELSIVLVIIGLIVGGVLMGRDLIGAAAVRAQISQIEKFNTAANTFREKFGYLPGDIKDPEASSFGFTARDIYRGQGDGNGIIEGNPNDTNTTANGAGEVRGETLTFWADLSVAHLIEGAFNTASNTNIVYVTRTSVPGISSLFPEAKLGRGNYVYVYSGGPARTGGSDSTNYFGVSVISDTSTNAITSAVGLTVQEAFSIDKKMDDGLPQSGTVTATYLSWSITYNGNSGWAAGGGVSGANSGINSSNGPTTAATSGSPTTCYDNGNVSGATQQYSVEISNGANLNCALSFRFQ